jgi:hypothetical protein
MLFYEIDRALHNNNLNGTISTFIGSLTALTTLLVIRVCMLLRASFFYINIKIYIYCEIEKIPSQQYIVWHDWFRVWPTDFTQKLVSLDHIWYDLYFSYYKKKCVCAFVEIFIET